MAANPLVERDGIIESLQLAVSGGEHGLKLVPPLIKRVIAEDCWRERYVKTTGERVEFSRFVDFIARHPPEGLGADLPLIKRMCSDDHEAIDLIDRVTMNKVGRPVNGVIHANNEEDQERDRSGMHIRRLRKDFGDLHAEVLAGDKSVTRAAIEAGIYPRRVSINLQSPDSAAQTIRRNASEEYITSLVRALLGGE